MVFAATVGVHLQCKMAHYPCRLYSYQRGEGVQSRLSVCSLSLKGKRLELSTHTYIYSIVVARHALTRGQKVKVQGQTVTKIVTVVSDTCCCYGRVLLLSAWVCMSIRLPMFSSYGSGADVQFATQTTRR